MTPEHLPDSEPTPPTPPTPPAPLTAAAGNGSAEPPRSTVAGARRIVIKLGTRVLTNDDGGLAVDRAAALIDAAAALRAAGRQIVVVSSGAVGLGQRTLGLARACPHRGLRQACAAVGQAELMSLYQREFARFSLTCGQILVSASDFESRSRALHLRAIVNTLLSRDVVPIINENDALGHRRAVPGAVEVPAFKDNDRLAALVAGEIGADLLVLLTDVPGLYDGDPRRQAGARLLSRIDDPLLLPVVSARPGSEAGRGGMASKVEAAMIACRSGCQTIIASGRDPAGLTGLLAGAHVGTWFPANRWLSARQRWIAYGAPARGALAIDAGAVTALRDRSASLLVAGVRGVDGDFQCGDVVELSEGGAVAGRAMTRLGSDATRHVCADRGLSSGTRVLVRRENIVMNVGARHEQR